MECHDLCKRANRLGFGWMGTIGAELPCRAGFSNAGKSVGDCGMALLPAYAFSLADYGSARNLSVDWIGLIRHVHLSILMILACLVNH